MRKARATWKISEVERRSVVRIGQLMREELPKAGLPEPILDDWIVNGRPADGALVDMAHIIGTTRMSDDPKTGVVDTQCEVYGVEGLYIAGSSIFPTSGHANPTLMILSIALRVADHLKRILAQQVGKAAA
jgi:choline dehydrogenase-like flavoprotein